ncbi:MAG: ThiF family adenylyltransferase [Deltaproteobacteria bacterium]|nr:ThiF family adenylyltransferase [Deltaproteobacteria bacterium]
MAVLFRELDRSAGVLPASPRFLSVAVIPFETEWITEASPQSVRFETKPLRQFFQRCEEESLCFGFVHNHPTGYDRFSDVDEENERTLLRALSNRNGPASTLVALLWTGERWLGRIRRASQPGRPVAARHVSVVGRPFSVHLPTPQLGPTAGHLARQAIAFGRPFAASLGSLRVGVVGCGGTGSPLATLLARSGVGELILFDPDHLEESNLNRVRGARKSDIGKNKAQLLSRYINKLGLPSTAVPVPSRLDDNFTAVEALSTADIIFGCTDDYAGREALNKACYAYLQPLIDMGIGGLISENAHGEPVLRSHSGRLSCVLPERGACLFCQRVITRDWIKHQLAVRRDPQRAAAEVAEGYLVGGGEAAPGVGPFTGAVADLAVTTFFDLIQPFRRLPPSLLFDRIFLNFITMEFESAEIAKDADCPFCGTRDFLSMREENYLLGRPILRQSNG